VTAELWLEDGDACDAAVKCASAEIAPGEAEMFDGRACSPDAARSAVVVATGPVAVAVDVATSDVFASYLAPAEEMRTLAGEELLGESAPVAYAPLVYKNYQGWTTLLHLQNTGDDAALLKASFLDRAGDAIAVRQFGPLCSGARTTVDLETVGGIPYWWVGSVRIERVPVDEGPVATEWAPEPTSTAEGTLYPSVTPGPTGPTPTSAYPTVTPIDHPTPTPVGPPPVFLPLVYSGYAVGNCRGAIPREEAVQRARAGAAGEGLGPPPGHDEPVVRKALLITAAEFDEMYPYDPIVRQGIPVIEPWDCFWDVELDVHGWWQGRPGVGPWEVTWYMNLLWARSGCEYMMQLAQEPPD
jgi:hypothetical protein